MRNHGGPLESCMEILSVTWCNNEEALNEFELEADPSSQSCCNWLVSLRLRAPGSTTGMLKQLEASGSLVVVP